MNKNNFELLLQVVIAVILIIVVFAPLGGIMPHTLILIAIILGTILLSLHTKQQTEETK